MRVVEVMERLIIWLHLVSSLCLINKQDSWYGVVGETCEVVDSC